MAHLETLLDDVRQHVKSANFTALAALAPQLEAALAEGGLTRNPAALRRIKQKADENAVLLDAARRGIRAARRRVEEARRVTTGLQTYDVKGRRAEIPPGGPTAGRF